VEYCPKTSDNLAKTKVSKLSVVDLPMQPQTAETKQFVENSLWTIEDLSEFLKLPVKTLYTWVSQKRLPHLKLGNRLRFRQKEIEKWLNRKGGHYVD
jgi:excisionase family DNA binding protein